MFQQSIASVQGAGRRRGFRGLTCGFQGAPTGLRGLSGLGDLFPNNVTTIEGQDYVFPGSVIIPNGWFAMSPDAQRAFVFQNGGQAWNGFVTQPQTFLYTLANGFIVELPINWTSMSTAEKLTWIERSDLSAANAIQLETESGIDSGAIRLPGGGAAGGPGARPGPGQTPSPSLLSSLGLSSSSALLVGGGALLLIVVLAASKK